MSWLISAGYKGAAVSDADAQTYLRAVEAADGQALEPAVARAVNEFVIGCKNDGIWNAIKASCILAGARTLNGALVPLVGAAPTNFNFTLANYNRKTGLKGIPANSTSLSTNRANNIDPQNSKHMAIYSSEIDTVTNYRQYITSVYTPSGWSEIGAGAQTDLTLHFACNSGQGATFANCNGIGLIGIARSNSANLTRRHGSVSTTFANTSVNPSSNVISVLVNTTARFAFYSIGESLDLGKLDARVTTLINALAAAIP